MKCTSTSSRRMQWILNILLLSIFGYVEGWSVKRFAGSIVLSSAILYQNPLNANAEEVSSSIAPCPGKYCRGDTKLNVIHTLGIPGISDRKFKDRKDFLKVDSWSTFASEEKTTSNHEVETNEICYIDDGKFTVIPDETSASKVPFGDIVPVRVVGGDFVVFPKGLKSQWIVEEPVRGRVLKY